MIRLVLLVCLPVLVMYPSSGESSPVVFGRIGRTNMTRTGLRSHQRLAGRRGPSEDDLGNKEECWSNSPTVRVGSTKIKPPEQGDCYKFKKKKLKSSGCLTKPSLCENVGSILQKGMQMMQNFKLKRFDTIKFAKRDEQVVVYPNGLCSIFSNHAEKVLNLFFSPPNPDEPEPERPEPEDIGALALTLSDSLKVIFKCLDNVLENSPKCFKVNDGKACGVKNVTQGTDVNITNPNDDTTIVDVPITLTGITLYIKFKKSSRSTVLQPINVNINPVAAHAKVTFSKGKSLRFKDFELHWPKTNSTELTHHEDKALIAFVLEQLKSMEERLREQLIDLGKKTTNCIIDPDNKQEDTSTVTVSVTENSLPADAVSVTASLLSTVAEPVTANSLSTVADSVTANSLSTVAEPVENSTENLLQRGVRIVKNLFGKAKTTFEKNAYANWNYE